MTSDLSEPKSAARAMLNILEDFVGEKERLQETQRALLNILDDFDTEIAERKQVEGELRRAKALSDASNRELEAFSYSVAHDLRAPLRSIDGFSQAVVEDFSDRLSAEGKSHLKRVRDSAQRMAAMIDDLLSLSRLSRAELRRTPVDLAVIARAVLARIKQAHPDRDVALTLPDTLPANGDEGLLTLALENLLGNAWKFTSRSSGARIEFGRRIEEGRTVYFVRDNGVGFDMAHAGNLFGVFQRLHPPAEFEGTGIGLATVRRIVDRHGGRIWAEGRVGQGAEFSFTLEESA